MRKSGYGYLGVALALMLMGVFVAAPWGAGPGALPDESDFYSGLHNSLCSLDEAKWKWAEEKYKSQGDIPTMKDLEPFLGYWTNGIKYFVARGIKYKLTPYSWTERQSDVATLTHDLSFQAGFCRFYRAGISYGILTGWTFPQSGSTFRILSFYQNNRGLLAGALFFSGSESLLVFAIKSHCRSNHSIFLTWLILSNAAIALLGFLFV